MRSLFSQVELYVGRVLTTAQHMMRCIKATYDWWRIVSWYCWLATGMDTILLLKPQCVGEHINYYARCWYSLKNEKRKDTRAPFGTYNDRRTGDVQTIWVYFTPGKCTRAGKKRILEEMSNAARVPLGQNRFQVWGVALARSKIHWIMSIWMKTYSVLMKLDKTRMVQTHGGLYGPF